MLTTPATTPNTFHRLVALPVDQYSQMVNLTTMQQTPLKQKLAQLQRDLSTSITTPSLSTDDRPPNPYDRLMRQGMLLEEMMRTKEQIQNDISLGTPKPYRNRALALYNQIAPITHFNEKGELVLKTTDGGDPTAAAKTVVGSRAEDLIQHAVRDRRKQFTPTGWTDFVGELHKHNVPRMMLNRQTIDELQTLSTKAPIALPATAAAAAKLPPPPPLKLPPGRGRAAKERKLKKKRSRKAVPVGFLRDFEP